MDRDAGGFFAGILWTITWSSCKGWRLLKPTTVRLKLNGALDNSLTMDLMTCAIASRRVALLSAATICDGRPQPWQREVAMPTVIDQWQPSPHDDLSSPAVLYQFPMYHFTFFNYTGYILGMFSSFCFGLFRASLWVDRWMGFSLKNHSSRVIYSSLMGSSKTNTWWMMVCNWN